MRPPVLFALLCLLAPTATALLPSALPCPVGSCALPNGGFEDVGADGMPAAWEPYTFPGQCFGEGVLRSTEHARGGVASVRIEDTPTRCTGVVSETVPIVPGLPYTVGMWAKAVEGAPQVGVFIAYYASADAPVQGYITKIPFAGNPGADWTWIGGTTQQVVGATHVRLWVYAPMGAAGVTHVDDLTLASPSPSTA